jgi:hypothetical protein
MFAGIKLAGIKLGVFASRGELFGQEALAWLATKTCNENLQRKLATKNLQRRSCNGNLANEKPLTGRTCGLLGRLQKQALKYRIIAARNFLKDR